MLLILVSVHLLDHLPLWNLVAVEDDAAFDRAPFLVGGGCSTNTNEHCCEGQETKPSQVTTLHLLPSSTRHGPLPVDRHLGRFGENHQNVTGRPRLLQGGSLLRRTDEILCPTGVVARKILRHRRRVCQEPLR